MAGNTLGQLFTLTSFGESHGPAIGGVVDGCPPGMDLSVDDIQPDLDRRKPGQSSFTTQRQEADQIQMLSGVFEGKTTGTPIGLLITNQDAKSKDYSEIKDKFRPGHADYTYQYKYGIRDYRGGGRSSARETAIRVAAGAIARKYLTTKYGITVRAAVVQIGEHCVDKEDWSAVSQNPFFCTDNDKVETFSRYIQQLRKQGDSIGAKITVMAENVPIGLGEPVFDRLDADIAHALMSINACKGVEIGAGFASVAQRGTEHRDELTEKGFTSNHAGGILGGISSGQTIRAHVAFKPTSSIITPAQTIDTTGNSCEIITKGRHDPCVGIRAVPIVEAMLLLVLMDHVLRYRGQVG